MRAEKSGWSLRWRMITKTETKPYRQKFNVLLSLKGFCLRIAKQFSGFIALTDDFQLNLLQFAHFSTQYIPGMMILTNKNVGKHCCFRSYRNKTRAILFRSFYKRGNSTAHFFTIRVIYQLQPFVFAQILSISHISDV